MKRILLILSLFIFSLPLTGCFGNAKTPSSELSTINTSGIELDIPATWENIPTETLPGLEEDVVAVFASPNTSSGFSNNIIITKESLSRSFSSIEYAAENIRESGRFLDEYLKIKEADVTVTGADEQGIATKLHVFEAKSEPQLAKRKYIQLYVVRESIGYTVTVTIPVGEQDTERYENMVTSLRFVNTE